MKIVIPRVPFVVKEVVGNDAVLCSFGRQNWGSINIIAEHDTIYIRNDGVTICMFTCPNITRINSDEYSVVIKSDVSVFEVIPSIIDGELRLIFKTIFRTVIPTVVTYKGKYVFSTVTALEPEHTQIANIINATQENVSTIHVNIIYRDCSGKLVVRGIDFEGSDLTTHDLDKITYNSKSDWVTGFIGVNCIGDGTYNIAIVKTS